MGEVPAGSTIVVTVTGHGLKDPMWALKAEDGSDIEPTSVPNNAAQVADYLTKNPKVESVSWAGLPSSPWNERAKKYFQGRGFGSIIAFNVKGGREAGQKFAEALKLHSHVANIGDVRSLVIHPASTTHSQLTEAEQLASGVHPGMVRLSVGLESIGDILADLDLGFAAV